MLLMPWKKLPERIRNDAVLPYYRRLEQRKASLVLKRGFDLILSGLLILLLSPLLAAIAIAIRLDSKGPAIYRQERVARFGKPFFICKFRTMVTDADRKGGLLTTGNDSRITRVGKFLRKTHLDELAQLFNVFGGSMSFVGTRPEVERYVSRYTPEMYATLLLRPGITSPASIAYKEENSLLSDAEDPETVYLSRILPDKMDYNLEYTRSFSFFGDLRIILQTALGIFS